MNPKPKDRNQHIKVFTRVRPRNSQEMRSHVIVECISNKDVAVKDKGQTKTFTFDRVFGPESTQVEVYKAVVGPLIAEVLQGYNCTVFAYGQTGTGKTFTMVGDRPKSSGNWQTDPMSGIIPRTLDHLFDELKVRAEDYTVRVSFLELYNEELCDLLAPLDMDDTKTLRLFEDSMKKGSVIVSGLEERTVYDKNDVFPILEAGSLRRQTAPTLMNAQSSRSHTIFTITVHVKVTTPDGEELFKTGKLNLVDLAGSENIGRSGAIDARAREAGNINQSLLTLGRVITSLVERTPHVPYRESKLTRILQDSLGGRTKTSIIATVSPALCNLEETLSTFDYAHRARNITNKPEINQKTSKHVLLKNYADEIERLRRDLQTAREKHGVYLNNETYNGMLNQIDNLNKDLVEKIQLLNVREDEFAKQEDIMKSLNMDLTETKNSLHRNIEILMAKENALQERERALQELNKQAQLLLQTADEATEDAKKLHDRLDRARMVHHRNQEVVEGFNVNLMANLNSLKSSTQAFQNRCLDQTEALKDQTKSIFLDRREHQAEVQEVTAKFFQDLQATIPVKTLLNQFDQTKPAIENQMVETREISKTLTSLGEELESRTASWRSSIGEEWENLTGLASDLLNEQLNLGGILANSKDCLRKGQSTLSDIPSKLGTTPERKRVDELWEKMHTLMQEQATCRKEQDELHKTLQILREKESERAMELESIKDELWRLREAEGRNLTNELTSLSNQHLNGVMSLLNAGEELNRAMIDTTNVVVPSIKRCRSEEENNAECVKKFCVDALAAASNRCASLVISQKNEIDILDETIVSGRKSEAETETILNAFKLRTEQLGMEEAESLASSSDLLLSPLQKLAHSIKDHCEETFANIHDRCNDLKAQELHRDEKTGNTPQRKDFKYPKRLISPDQFREDSENMPPLDIQLENVSE